jgi:hypothetical protein
MVPREIKTLIYSDIFDYPLTLSEVHQYLITDKKTSLDLVKKNLTTLKINNSRGYYFLNKRKNIVDPRIEREKESNKKINFAFHYIGLLKFIPGIRLIGISGSVSVKNASKNDDIDLFIVTRKESIWLARFFAVTLLRILGVYRSRVDKKTTNKLCLNMFVDEDNLAFPKDKRNLYTAHEISQLLPIIDKNMAYESFIKNNAWISKYLSNFEPKLTKKSNDILILSFLWKVLLLLKFEKLAKFIQIKYMRDRKGKEIIKNGFLAFHPEDYENLILKKYSAKVKLYENTTRGH